MGRFRFSIKQIFINPTLSYFKSQTRKWVWYEFESSLYYYLIVKFGTVIVLNLFDLYYYFYNTVDSLYLQLLSQSLYGHFTLFSFLYLELSLHRSFFLVPCEVEIESPLYLQNIYKFVFKSVLWRPIKRVPTDFIFYCIFLFIYIIDFRAGFSCQENSHRQTDWRQCRVSRGNAVRRRESRRTRH